MPNIPQSITVTIRNGGNFRATRLGKTFKGFGMDFGRVRKAFPKTPNPPYQVTYAVNPRGKYLVELTYGHTISIVNLGGSEPADADGTFACFLPRAGDGLRVSRKVTAIRKGVKNA